MLGRKCASWIKAWDRGATEGEKEKERRERMEKLMMTKAQRSALGWNRLRCAVRKCVCMRERERGRYVQKSRPCFFAHASQLRSRMGPPIVHPPHRKRSTALLFGSPHVERKKKSHKTRTGAAYRKERRRTADGSRLFVLPTHPPRKNARARARERERKKKGSGDKEPTQSSPSSFIYTGP